MRNPADLVVPRDKDVGFIGSGSLNQATTLQPGEIRTLTLHAFTQDIRQTSYAVTFSLVTDNATDSVPLTLTIQQPQPNIVFQQLSVDPNTRITLARLTNNDATVTDLDFDVVQNTSGIPANVSVLPDLHHVYLPAGQSIDFQIIPLDLAGQTGYTPLPNSTRLVSSVANPTGSSKLNTAQQTLPGPFDGKICAGQDWCYVIPAVCDNHCGSGLLPFSFNVTQPVTNTVSSSAWYCTNKPNIDVALRPSISIPPNASILNVSVSADFTPSGGEVYSHAVELLFNNEFMGGATVPDQARLTLTVSPDAWVSGGAQTINLRSVHPFSNLSHYVVANNFTMSVQVSDYTANICAIDEADARNRLGLKPKPTPTPTPAPACGQPSDPGFDLCYGRQLLEAYLAVQRAGRVTLRDQELITTSDAQAIIKSLSGTPNDKDPNDIQLMPDNTNGGGGWTIPLLREVKDIADELTGENGYNLKVGVQGNGYWHIQELRMVRDAIRLISQRLNTLYSTHAPGVAVVDQKAAFRVTFARRDSKGELLRFRILRYPGNDASGADNMGWFAQNLGGGVSLGNLVFWVRGQDGIGIGDLVDSNHPAKANLSEMNFTGVELIIHEISHEFDQLFQNVQQVAPDGTVLKATLRMKEEYRRTTDDLFRPQVEGNKNGKQSTQVLQRAKRLSFPVYQGYSKDIKRYTFENKNNADNYKNNAGYIIGPRSSNNEVELVTDAVALWLANGFSSGTRYEQLDHDQLALTNAQFQNLLSLERNNGDIRSQQVEDLLVRAVLSSKLEEWKAIQRSLS